MNIRYHLSEKTVKPNSNIRGMDIQSLSLVQSLRELQTITDCFSDNNNAKRRHPRGKNQSDYKCTRGKLWCILRSPKIRSTFYTESTLRKLLCKPKNREADCSFRWGQKKVAERQIKLIPNNIKEANVFTQTTAQA